MQTDVQGFICAQWECLQLSPTTSQEPHKIPQTQTDFKATGLQGSGEIRKGENIHFNMPEESENKMRADVMAERVTLVTTPKTRKRQIIQTKASEERGGRWGKKEALCV